jgi:hypothetical protein
VYNAFELPKEFVMLKSRTIILSFLACLSLVSLAAAQATDVSGEWELTIQSPRGEMTSTAKFVQDGEKLTVTMTGPRGREATGEGTIKGNALQWSVTRSGPDGQEFTIKYSGTVEGTTMSGTAETPRGSVNWKATKK